MRITDLVEDWKDSTEIPVPFDEGYLSLENTPQGVLVHGDDLRFNEDRAYVEFTYNLTTGQLVDSKVSHGYNRDEYDYDWSDVELAIDEAISYVRDHYGSTWKEIEKELHGGIEIEEPPFFDEVK